MSEEQVGRLTDRKAWLHYIKPAIEKAKKYRGEADKPSPPDVGPVAPGDKVINAGETREEHLAFMRRIGVKGVPEA